MSWLLSLRELIYPRLDDKEVQKETVMVRAHARQMYAARSHRRSLSCLCERTENDQIWGHTCRPTWLLAKLLLVINLSHTSQEFLHCRQRNLSISPSFHRSSSSVMCPGVLWTGPANKTTHSGQRRKTNVPETFSCKCMKIEAHSRRCTGGIMWARDLSTVCASAETDTHAWVFCLASLKLLS